MIIIDLSPDERLEVEQMMRRHVPTAEIGVIGSRVDGRARASSDLDIVVMGEESTPVEVIQALRYDFQYSGLSVAVDLVCYASCSTAFRQVINSTYQVLLRKNQPAGSRYRHELLSLCQQQSHAMTLRQWFHLLEYLEADHRQMKHRVLRRGLEPSAADHQTAGTLQQMRQILRSALSNASYPPT